ncbi:MAG: lytic transglycosylase domain-containing protein [Tannerella sp.]|jgi:hypothetical protein|nr:lytic transglycosylase domain-containing protein [Tannerella sp.]
MQQNPNNIRPWLYVLGISAAALAGATLLLSFLDSQTPAGKPQDLQPQVAALTVTPHVPDWVEFCGARIDLERYNRHEGFDREIASFTYQHSATLLLFKRANRIFPIIEPILKQYDIPDDFKYLAVIESQLNPKANSPARAVGLWQFVETTAREYGLRITSTVDERCDIAKSTVAACRYLRAAYDKYGDWLSVASSYNGGMGRISSASRYQGGQNSLDLWLVEETSRYPYRIMAIKQIFENPYRYGFLIRPFDLYKPIRTRSVEVKSDISDLPAFARAQGITYADLKRFNPWLRDRRLLTAGRKYQLLIPDPADMSYDQPNTYVHDPRWVAN